MMQERAERAEKKLQEKERELKKLQKEKKKQEEHQQELKKERDDAKEHVARLRGMGINGLPAEELRQLKSAHEDGIRRVQQEIERHEAKSAVASTDKYNCSLTLDLMDPPTGLGSTRNYTCPTPQRQSSPRAAQSPAALAGYPPPAQT